MSRDAEPDRGLPADSAGVPWAGRSLNPHPFAGDDGSPDPSLAEALDRVASEAGRFRPQAHQDVVRAFARARVFVPIVADLGESGADHGGLVADKSAEMAMVTVAAEDGRRAAPGFSGMSELSAWNPGARPVPVEATRLALAAVDEGSQLVVVNPGTPRSFLIRRPALWLLAQGRASEWAPAWANVRVAEAIAEIARGEPWIAGVSLRPGSTNIVHRGPELAIVLTPAGEPPGSEALDELRSRLAGAPVVGECVDSIALSVGPGQG